MAVRSFDRKFGADFLASLPDSPGIYLVYDGAGELIYVGKAKNLKRRLAQYRNTQRLKKHRRMRGIVAAAWAASLVALLVLGWVAYEWRGNVMAAWPPSERLYAALGLKPAQE